MSDIDAKYQQLGGPGGFLGNPASSENTTPDGVGRYRHFQGGSIYWTPATGAHEVHGEIRNKWSSLGWERSSLGYPFTDELVLADGIGRYNHFQGGSIHWKPTSGAVEIHDGSATPPVFTPTEFVNWHHNIRKTVPTVRPANLAELVSAVRLIQSRSQFVGTAGSGWSFTDCVVGKRTQAGVDTSGLNATLWGLIRTSLGDRTKDGKPLVHVEAGIKLYDLNCRLDGFGLALPTMGGSRGQSLAGA